MVLASLSDLPASFLALCHLFTSGSQTVLLNPGPPTIFLGEQALVVTSPPGPPVTSLPLPQMLPAPAPHLPQAFAQMSPS